MESTATAELTPTDDGNMWGENTEAQQGTISISTNPSGATVWLGTKKLGTAPVSTSVDFGSYTIKVELDGYVTDLRSVNVQSSDVSVPFELKAMVTSGTVQIFSKQSYLIYIDGERAGTTPVVTTLSAGEHTIKVVSEDGTSSTMSRNVQFKDDSTPFIIDLSN